MHHADKDWAHGGQTNIDDLTLACGPHNRLVKKSGWTTRKNAQGETERMLPDGDDGDDDADDESDCS